MTRFFIVEPDSFFDHVDQDAFNAAVQEAESEGQVDHAKALEEMKANGIVGFTYLYNDADRDPDFQRRAQVVRGKEKLPGNHSIWEMNIWYVPGAKDEHVQRAAREALGEFQETLVREKTMVMFVDSGDLQEGYEQAAGSRATLRELSRTDNRQTAERGLQDTRVLNRLGFHFVLRVKYDGEEPVKDFAYALRIAPPEAN